MASRKTLEKIGRSVPRTFSNSDATGKIRPSALSSKGLRPNGDTLSVIDYNPGIENVELVLDVFQRGTQASRFHRSNIVLGGNALKNLAVLTQAFG